MTRLDPAAGGMVARREIHDVLRRYCHGIDCCDADMLKSACWPDAHQENGTVGGPAWEVAEHIAATMLQSLLRSTQMIGDAVIELDADGNHARVESYVVAYLQLEEDGQIIDRTVAGRYLDRFERRDGEWRILRRLYVLEWDRNVPAMARWDEGRHAILRVPADSPAHNPRGEGVPHRQGVRMAGHRTK